MGVSLCFLVGQRKLRFSLQACVYFTLFSCPWSVHPLGRPGAASVTHSVKGGNKWLFAESQPELLRTLWDCHVSHVVLLWGAGTGLGTFCVLRVVWDGGDPQVGLDFCVWGPGPRSTAVLLGGLSRVLVRMSVGTETMCSWGKACFLNW